MSFNWTITIEKGSNYKINVNLNVQSGQEVQLFNLFRYFLVNISLLECNMLLK